MMPKSERSAESRATHRELTDEDIRTAIKNSGGVRGTLLIPDAPFELLVRRAIGRLLTPALQCKEFVHAELLRIAGQCAPPDIGRFPALQVRKFVLAGGQGRVDLEYVVSIAQIRKHK